MSLDSSRAKRFAEALTGREATDLISRENTLRDLTRQQISNGLMDTSRPATSTYEKAKNQISLAGAWRHFPTEAQWAVVTCGVSTVADVPLLDSPSSLEGPEG